VKHHSHARWLCASFAVVLLHVALASTSASGQEPRPVITPDPDGKGAMVSPAAPTDRQSPADPSGASSVRLNFPVDSSLLSWVKFFADLRRMTFIIADLQEIENKKVTIISNEDVSPDAAWEAFLSALHVNGFGLSITGRTAKIVKLGQGGALGSGVPRDSDAYVTQLITLENTRVDDAVKIISSVAGPESKIVAYAPTNTLIISDTAANIRKIYQVLVGLDVASPKSTMQIYALRFASAEEVKEILEQLYNTKSPEVAASSRSASRAGGRRPQPESEAVSAGTESKFIGQVIHDERTNSLLVLANEEGHAAVRDLIERIDVDVSQEGEIHLVYLEHAKAVEVAAVLAELSQKGSSTPQPNWRRESDEASRGAATQPKVSTAGGLDEGQGSGALAAFDSGMRIAADESTNSLVIIAGREDFIIVKRVIDQLDIERKQVFVDAIVLELSSQDASSFGLAAHVPQSTADGQVGYIGTQLGASSLGLSTDALTGLAMGVFGKSISVPVFDEGTLTSTTVDIPSFGVALNALKSTGITNIISNPSLMTLDNQEATIVVGRKVPFATSSGYNSLGQQTFSYEREDVATTLILTPRINSANYVTLELQLEVQEVEDSAQSSLTAEQGGGFITSQRKVETAALVADNQTMVIGGLIGTTESTSESKVPILGDIPLLGALFRSKERNDRKTDMMVFLTPHIVDEPEDMIEIQRVKEAQRQEFLRRFYGKNQAEFAKELQSLLRYSMNFVDEPPVYRGPDALGLNEQMSEDPAGETALGQDTGEKVRKRGAKHRDPRRQRER
jgi:general secretion pathway protein D